MSSKEMAHTHLVRLLRPPVGLTLCGVLGTTYSTDLESVTALLLGLYGVRHNADEERMGDGCFSPLKSLLALKKVGDSIRVMVHPTGVRPGSGHFNSKLNTLVADILRDGPAPMGSFHPKVWVAGYSEIGSSKITQFRIICASRNLSQARTWELYAALDAEVAQRGSADTVFCNSVADFLAYAVGKNTDRPWILPLIERLRTARLVGDVGQPQFLWQSSERKALSSYWPKNAKRVLVVSPFLKGMFLETLKSHCSEWIIVSNQGELDRLDPKWRKVLQKPPHRSYAMLDHFKLPIDHEDNGEKQYEAMLELHAKLVVFELEDGTHRSFLGSANASYSAYLPRSESPQRAVNTEAVVELGDAVKIDDFLGDFVFRKKDECQPWISEWSAQDITEENEEDEKLQKAVEDIFALIAKSVPTGEYNNGALSICLHKPKGLIGKLDEFDLELNCLPVSQYDPAAIRPHKVDAAQFSFPLDCISDLCDRLVFWLTLDGKTQSSPRILQVEIDLSQYLEKRNQAILEALLKGMDYAGLLMAMLSSSSYACHVLNNVRRSAQQKTSGQNDSATVHQDLPWLFLEDLLRTVTDTSSAEQRAKRCADISELVSAYENSVIESGQRDERFDEFVGVWRGLEGRLPQ